MFCTISNDKCDSKLEPYILYKNEKHSYLPRYISDYISNKNIYQYIDPKFVPEKTKPYNFLTEVRPEQVDVLNSILQVYNANGSVNGIIHARPGFGKSFSSIWLAWKLQKKTLIIIDTINIINQWKTEILKHTDLTEDDIGIIKGKKCEVDGKLFILATPQTLASMIKRDIKDAYAKLRDAGIDLICWDEVHIMGGKYASASLLFNTKNIIGLSATPYNPHERDTLIKSIFGEVLVKYGEYDFQPTVKFIKYNSGLGDKYGKRVCYMWSKDFIQGRSIYNSKLTESTTWIENIYTIVKQEVEAGNKIILLCMTKIQLLFICKYLESKGIVTTKLYSEKNDIDKLQDNTIVATYKYASKAFDYAELSRLILTVPLSGKKSLIQSIGRIVRKFEGKTDATVYDLIDTDAGFRELFTLSINVKINILKSEFDDCEFIVCEN